MRKYRGALTALAIEIGTSAARASDFMLHFSCTARVSAAKAGCVAFDFWSSSASIHSDTKRRQIWQRDARVRIQRAALVVLGSSTGEFPFRRSSMEAEVIQFSNSCCRMLRRSSNAFSDLSDIESNACSSGGTRAARSYRRDN